MIQVSSTSTHAYIVPTAALQHYHLMCACNSSDGLRVALPLLSAPYYGVLLRDSSGRNGGSA